MYPLSLSARWVLRTSDPPCSPPATSSRSQQRCKRVSSFSASPLRGIAHLNGCSANQRIRRAENNVIVGLQACEYLHAVAIIMPGRHAYQLGLAVAHDCHLQTLSAKNQRARRHCEGTGGGGQLEVNLHVRARH